MTRYAANTSVDSSASRAEIERTLMRYGADQFMYGWKDEAALVAFRMHNRQVRFLLPMPRRDAAEFRLTPHQRRTRTAESQERAYEQAVRQRWRASALVIKAKLEAVESGITEFEDEFLAHIVMPDGKTVGEHSKPMIATAYETGNMPTLLPDYTQ